MRQFTICIQPKGQVYSKKSTSPHPPTTSVLAQVNSPEVDPYDELPPTVIEVPPTNPPRISTMEQSVYANFYENYPPDGSSHVRRNVSPSTPNSPTSPRPISPMMVEPPFKFTSTSGEEKLDPLVPELTATVTSPQSTLECNNNTEHQVCNV